MPKNGLPLAAGNAVVVNGVPRTVAEMTSDQIVLRDESGEDLTLSIAQAADFYQRGKLSYDNALLRRLDKGSAKDQRLAAHGRRPLPPDGDALLLEIERNHYIATRADQFFEEMKGLPGYAKRPGKDEGYDKFSKLVTAEIKDLARDGEPWASLDVDIKRNFARNIHRRWEKTQSKAALARMNWAKGVRETQAETLYIHRILKRILTPLWLKRPWVTVVDVYEDFIVPALVVAWRKGKITRPHAPPVGKIYAFINKNFDAAEVGRCRGTSVEAARLQRVKKIIPTLSPFERIEADSTELPEYLDCYNERGEVVTLDPPWATLALDVATNVNIGLYISWRHPSYEATRQVLRQALWPKDETTLCGAINAWPSGKAKNDRTRIVGDRGSENNNDPLPIGLGALKLAFTLTRARCPMSKSHIERHIGTTKPKAPILAKKGKLAPLKMRSSASARLMGNYAKKFIAGVRKRGGQRPWDGKIFRTEAEARAQLPAIIRWYTHRIVDGYNVRRPSRGGESPLACFNRLSPGKVEYPPTGDKIFLGNMHQLVVKPEGMEIGPFRFDAPEFDEILGRRTDISKGHRKKHCVFHDPEHPPRAMVFDQPDKGIARWIQARPRNEGALRSETYGEWKARADADREMARKERSYEHLSAAHEAKKRRDANNTKNETALADRIANVQMQQERHKLKPAASIRGGAKRQPDDIVEPVSLAIVKTAPKVAAWRQQPNGSLADFFKQVEGDDA